MACRLTILALALACASGCIRRTLTIESEPHGAAVYYDHRKVGQTPLALRFTHYGSHSLILVKEGFRPYRGRLTLEEKGWAVFPLDLVTEAVLPARLRDDRHVSITLSKASSSPQEESEDPLPE